jgi:hypothetical protein
VPNLWTWDDTRGPNREGLGSKPGQVRHYSVELMRPQPAAGYSTAGQEDQGQGTKANIGPMVSIHRPVLSSYYGCWIVWLMLACLLLSSLQEAGSGRKNYIVGLDAERVIVENMRKKVEQMKTSLTPDFSRQGSNFELSPSLQVRRRICTL